MILIASGHSCDFSFTLLSFHISSHVCPTNIESKTRVSLLRLFMLTLSYPIIWVAMPLSFLSKVNGSMSTNLLVSNVDPIGSFLGTSTCTVLKAGHCLCVYMCVYFCGTNMQCGGSTMYDFCWRLFLLSTPKQRKNMYSIENTLVLFK